MIAIALKFPAGRFHATPWGRHVNEGAPEWPPSPWRILRSLVATWKRKLDDRLTTEQMLPILSALTEPPSFRLPAASTGHTRHYMPLRFPDRGDRTKVFDTFVAVPREARLVAMWPSVTMDNDGRERLALVLAHVGFLGRAESWCEVSLLDDAEAADVTPDCKPLNRERPTDGHEIVRVLCAHRSAAFDNAHTPKVPLAAGGKKTTKPELRPLYDPDWHLCMETSELHDKRWSDPPGSTWTRYVRRSDCFAIQPTTRRIAGPHRPRPQVARFALDSAVLPLLQATLPVAEQARRALMGLYGKLNPQPDGRHGASEILSGKSADGEPLKTHGHAYFLPTDEDGDGRLDHLTVYASDGFGPEELRALDKFTFLPRDEGAAPLRVLLLGLGLAAEFGSGPLKTSRVWVSTTPFLVTRHPKRRGRKKDALELLNSRNAFVRQVLSEELERLRQRREIPGWSIPEEPAEGMFKIRPKEWAAEAGDLSLRPIQFKRFRQKRSDDGGRRPAGTFRIEFDAEVRGPICLGHSSHFGMGLFLPAAE